MQLDLCAASYSIRLVFFSTTKWRMIARSFFGGTLSLAAAIKKDCHPTSDGHNLIPSAWSSRDSKLS